MQNRPTSWMVTRLRGTSQEYLSSYHLTMLDHACDSTWSAEEIMALKFDTREEANSISERFPGTFVQEFMEYEDDE